MYDFHTHTFLSDGVLSPIELIRRAHVKGYRVMAVTDHVGPGNMEMVLKMLKTDCRAASERWDVLALPGVEITHCPKEDIDRLAKEAKALAQWWSTSTGRRWSSRWSPARTLQRCARSTSTYWRTLGSSRQRRRP